MQHALIRRAAALGRLVPESVPTMQFCYVCFLCTAAVNGRQSRVQHLGGSVGLLDHPLATRFPDPSPVPEVILDKLSTVFSRLTKPTKSARPAAMSGTAQSGEREKIDPSQ